MNTVPPLKRLHQKRRQPLRTRSAVLDAAGEVFADRGYEQATIRDICRRAGANIAGVSYHFGDKKALYIEVIAYAHRCADEVTGLANRTQLLDRIDAAVHAAKWDPQPFLLLSIQVDQVDQLKQAMGYGAGDAMAMAVAMTMTMKMAMAMTISTATTCRSPSATTSFASRLSRGACCSCAAGGWQALRR